MQGEDINIGMYALCITDQRLKITISPKKFSCFPLSTYLSSL